MKIWMVLQNEFLTHCSCGTHKNKSLAWRDMGLYFIVFTDEKDKSHMVDHPYSLVLMKNNFIGVPVRYYYKNKSGLFWIFRLWLLKKLPIFLTPMPLSCRCSHQISIRKTNSEFSLKLRALEKQIKRKFIICSSWKDAVISKICKKFAIPALLLFVYLWISPQTIYSFGNEFWILSFEKTNQTKIHTSFLMKDAVISYFFWAFSLEIFCVVRTLYTITMHDVI